MSPRRPDERPADADGDSPVKHLSCPKCGTSNVRRSNNEGVIAAIQRIFGRWPFRCRSCRARFYRAAGRPKDY